MQNNLKKKYISHIKFKEKMIIKEIKMKFQTRECATFQTMKKT